MIYIYMCTPNREREKKRDIYIYKDRERDRERDVVVQHDSCFVIIFLKSDLEGTFVLSFLIFKKIYANELIIFFSSQIPFTGTYRNRSLTRKKVGETKNI